jgi:Protein of unknown function (DUF1552)
MPRLTRPLLPSRRTLLRAGGAALSVPFFASAADRTSWALPPVAPVRLVVAVIPNGLYSPWFFPTTVGSDYDLPALLAPLAALQSRVSVLSGVHNWSGLGLAGHPEGLGTLLTDAPFQMYCPGNGVSFDQVIASVVGPATGFHSLQVGVTNPLGGLPDPCMDKVSWSADGSGLPPITDPTVLFERLFEPSLGDPLQREVRVSILDRVLERTNALRKRVNASDASFLDQYETGLRDLEERILAPGEVLCAAAAPAQVTTVDLATPIQYQLVATALQCDLTRVVTFLQGPTATNEIYGWVGAEHGLHELSHNAYTDDAQRDQYAATGVWHVQQFMDFVALLSTLPDADGGDLLSNTICVLVTEFADSNAHHTYGPPYSLPILVAGGENAGIVQGHHRALGERSTSDLYLGLMQYLGVEAASFGGWGTSPITLS